VILCYFILYLITSGFAFALIESTVKIPFVFFISSGVLTFICHPSLDSFVRVISAIGYYCIFKTLAIFAYADQSIRLDLLKKLTFIFILYVSLTLPALIVQSAYYFERLQGFTSNPNELGSVLFLAVVVFLVYKKYCYTSSSQINLINFVLLIASVMLYMTKSKGALLSVLFFIAITMVSKGWVIIAISFLPTVAMLYIVKLLNVDLFISTYTSIYNYYQEPLLKLRLDPSSIKYRLHFAQVFLDDYFFSNADLSVLLFGRGLKTFDKQIPLDNAYLFSFYEQGLLSLLFIVSFMVIILKRHVVYVKNDNVLKYFSAFCISLIFYSNFESRLFLGINYITLLFIMFYIFVCLPPCITEMDIRNDT